MGIKDLSDLLRDHNESITLDDISGYRVAVDTSIYLYKYARSTENWVDRLIDLVRALRKRLIKPVFVFDGPNIPEEKKPLSIKRREEEKKFIQKMETLQSLDLQDPEIFTKVKKLFPKTKNIPTDVIMLRKWVAIKIEKMKFESRAIDSKVNTKAKEILKLLGMAMIFAEGEAETVCVNLCYSGKVDAVLSNDTDVLAYIGGEQCNLIMLRNLELKGGGMADLEFISKRQLLKEIDFNERQFLDLCILLGCDYNSRVKGFGIATAEKMIRVNETIEALIENEHIKGEDIELTRYQRCRELFECKRIDQIVPGNESLEEESLALFLKENGSRHKVFHIVQDWVSTLSPKTEKSF